jgi:HEAT repeat protein
MKRAAPPLGRSESGFAGRLGQALRSAFGIRGGEGAPVAWLVAHSLCMGLFSAFFLTAANALFLGRFAISYLPLAYVAAALVGYAALMLFSRMLRRQPLVRALVLNLLLLLAVVAGLWLLLLVRDSQAVVFLLFVCVGPAFSLLALGYWALAGRLFDLRQGKRLFGLVGAGEEVVTVAGLFSVPILVKALGGPVHLLPIALAGLVGCLAVVLAIARRFPDALAENTRPGAAAAEAGERAGLRGLLRSRYFLLMAALVILLNVANYVVDFAFLSQVRARFQGPSGIAQFLGLFFGVTKTLELVAKVFLSGRLLTQFGLRFGLVAMPALLAGCAAFAIAIGTLGLPLAHFFVLVALAKLVFIVTRTTTFEPAFRVFYQPLPGLERLSFQAHVEGTARQLAVGAVGVGLLLWSRNPAFDALRLFYALLPLLAGWIAIAVLAHRDYRDKLLASLKRSPRAAGAGQPADLLRAHLRAEDPAEREQGFDLLEKIEGAAFARKLGPLAADPDPRLRQATLEHVGRSRLIDLEPLVRERLADEHGDVRTAAARALDELREARARVAAPDRILGLAQSADASDRVLAAEAIGRSGACAERLWVLMFDAEWTVRRAALLAAGRLGLPEFWPQMLSELGSPVLASAAGAALVALGERVLPEAERAFNKADQAPRVRQRILEVYEAVGGAQAEALLAAKLAFPHQAVRAQALSALSRSRYRADATSGALVARALESLVGQVAWNMSAVLDLGDDPRLAAVVAALEEEIEGSRARLFQLLSLLHDPAAIQLARENIESGSGETTVYALEILDLLLGEELKPLVFPVLESLPYPQALRRLEALYPRHRMAPAERLSLIVNRDYDKIGSWTRAAALAAEGELAPGVDDLVACLHHPDPLISELAATTLRRRDALAYARHRDKLDYEARERLAYVMGPDDTLEHWDSRSVFGRATLARGLAAFAPLPLAALARLARASEELVLNPGRRVPSPRAPRESFYVNVDGAQLLSGSEPRRPLPPQSLLGFGPATGFVEVMQATRFVRIDPDVLYDLAAEHVALVPALFAARQQRFAAALAAPRAEAATAPIGLAVAGA